MTIESELAEQTPRQFLYKLGVEIDATDHRPIEEIARYFGYVVLENLNTKNEAIA